LEYQGHGPIRLRLRTYAAESRERVLRLWLSSSLFPQLPGRARKPFRVALAALIVALGVFALLRWQAPMIAIATFGLPLLFVAYLREIDVRRYLGLGILVSTAAIGIVLGVVWAYLAGTVFASGYTVALGSGMTSGPGVGYGLAVSISEGLLMLAPALLVRLCDRSPRESLHGFLIGSLGATAFTAAANMILLEPQLTAGPIADNRSLSGLFVQAGIQGVAMPLVSVAVGGIVGIALWFRRPAGASQHRPGPVPAAVLVVIAVFVGLGLLDVSPISDNLYLLGYLVIAALAILALRVALQAALLHEDRDGMGPGEVFRCADCDHVGAGTSFCTRCGVATRVSAKTFRTNYGRILGPVGLGAAVGIAVTVITSIAITPGVAPYTCPPDCGSPPFGTPVETNPRFYGEGGSFSVSYPGEGAAYQATFNPNGLNGVVLHYVGGDTGTLALFGEPARDRSAKQIALGILKKDHPDATIDYEIPNASVGYQSGYGIVADTYPQVYTGRYLRLRVLILVAVKHDYALIASAVGPYHRFSADYGSGHPSGANLELAMDMGKYVNSFQWGGDRYGKPKT
jgi:hypothetical protein